MDMVSAIEAAEKYVSDEHELTFAAEVSRLIAERSPELADRFYQPLSFGTGGLRGKIGGGTNRMNPLVVARTTQAIGEYLQNFYSILRVKIAICYDYRRHSRYFSKLASFVLARMGIEVFLFSFARPTPMLSFAVREKECHAGIMITASHNPPEYNGYKVYWSDGAQIVSPHDSNIENIITSLHGPIFKKSEVSLNLDYLYNEVARYHRSGLISYSDDSLDKQFLESVLSQRRHKDLSLSEVSIAYTPLHGVGITVIDDLAKQLNIVLAVEPLQGIPDGEFSHTKSPNPEDPVSLDRVTALCKEKSCDVLVATDPDADRLGTGVRNDDTIILIDGNQLGALMIDYLLAQSSPKEQPYVVVNTIVTSDLQSSIINFYSAQQIQTLTGFKHIAEVLRALKKKNELDRFLMGTEESYGFLIGTHSWDKDAITAIAVFSEMVAYYASRGCTLIDRLHELYKQHGYFLERTISFVHEGSEGLESIKNNMQMIRSTTRKMIGTYPVTRCIDYLKRSITHRDGRVEQFEDTPASNVLKWYLDGFGWLCIRPSGTEPKIKLYFSYLDKDCVDVAASQKKAIQAIEEFKPIVLKDLSIHA